MEVLVSAELGAENLQPLQAAFPDVQVVVAPGGDAPSAASCEVVFGRVTGPLVDAAPGLRWVHVPYAGVNSLPLRALGDRGIVLTNASGAFGASIAETLLGMMLAFTTRLPALLDAQRRREWVSSRVDLEKQQLRGATLLILGLGDIGGSLAVRASAFGMRVLGVRRSDRPAPEGVDELVPRSELHQALGRADHVALCLPLTPETERLFGEAELRAMRPNAYLYNVGRGRSIDREALLAALREDRIAGAGLDVTDPEPLSPDDPLWAFPNVILTQHTGGSSPDYEREMVALFADNLRRYLGREPLRGVVDLERGY